MDLKKIFLIIVTFVLELIFLSKDLRFNNNETFKSSNVDVEFVDSKSYFISDEGISKILIAKKIQQFPHYKIFTNPIATIYGKKFTKVIVANFAKYQDSNSKLELKNNIKILYQDKKLKTSWLLYDSKKEVILDSKKFTILSKNMKVEGNHLYFDIKDNIIKAKNIDYKFKQE